MTTNKGVISVSISKKYIEIIDAEVTRKNKKLLGDDKYADTINRSDLLRYCVKQYCDHLNKSA